MRLPVLLLLSTCLFSAGAPALAKAPRQQAAWAFEKSDVPLDQAFKFGRLANGMRYVIRRNATPKGTAQVRLDIAAGSLDEHDAERGYAHFVEHMAFNGSSRVPEGEMIKLLERQGLAFGADTNASTGYEQTIYRLDLPRNDPNLLDTALMLMRETASELTFDPKAVARERGVILAERRDRNTWQFRNLTDQIEFLHPNARYGKRMPIGLEETISAATAESLKAFWRREYVPAQATVVVVGDFEPAAVEAAIQARFADWRPAPAEPRPEAGPVDPKAAARTDIYIDPALTERIIATRHGPWLDEPDTLAQRDEDVLRQIGYGIVNRRLKRLSRQANPPFLDAGFGTGAVFRVGRSTNLVINSIDKKWRRGITAAVEEYRRALTYGFSKAEIAEQVAGLRTATRNAAASADTRPHGALVNAVFALLHDDRVPSTPQATLKRVEALIPKITPTRVLAALKREAVPLTDPLIRFEGRNAPEGGADALRAAWDAAASSPVERGTAAAEHPFAYTDYGPAGEVVGDTREPLLGIRELRFANGVRLNIKRTDLQRERVHIQLSLDGGSMLATADNPLAIAMMPMFTAGGLGKHSQDELQSLLAGHTVSANVAGTPETFVSTAQTTPADLELQLQLMTAFLTDPGFRPEGELRYRLDINNYFSQRNATPQSAMNAAIGGILSDDDPRFTLQNVDRYRALTFAKLKQDISDRLAKGAIEIGIVGDIDEDRAIALVARTFGALPAREHDFGAYADRRQRTFTANTSPRVIRHTGPADQALIRVTWPSRDDFDPQEKQVLNVLERIVRLELSDELREKLGTTYSPGASSDPSPYFRGYGTFTLTASVDVKDVPAVRAAIAETIASLRDKPVDADLMRRAREPLLESYDNTLKTNQSWMTLVDRAQTEADRIERHVKARGRLAAVTVADVQAAARKYLAAGRAVEVTALPEGIDVPKP